MPGQSIGGRFRILREVGRGGMGVVYEALDEKLDRRVAVKCAKPGHHSSLPPEARAASEVSHYNVCKVHEIHSTETPFGAVDYLTMEFIDGETLWQRVNRKGKLAEAEAREIAQQLCAGLAQAHKQGVVHGDLKCPNVILTLSKKGETRAVLTDFGLARSQAGEGSPVVMSRHGGTLDYMAPELFQGARASIATDIYALGVLFHVMLTGQAPQRLTEPRNALLSVEPHDSTATMIETKGVETERQIDKLPAPWRQIVKRCLAVTPAKRFESAEQACFALEPRRKISKWIPVLALGLIAATGVAIWQNREPEGEAVRLAVFPALVQGDAIPTAAGIVQDVASRLNGRGKNLLVIPPFEAQRNQAITVERARSALGATHVLRAKLNQAAGRITLAASLIDTASGREIKELSGTYAITDAAAIAKALTATVTGAFHIRSGVEPEAVSQAAYPFYVQGIAVLRRDSTSADEALPLLQKAVDLDPRSALPFAGLAEAQIQKFQHNYGKEWLERAAENVSKAKSLNPDSVPVLLVSASFQRQHGWYEKALQDLQRAVELDARNSDAWRMLANVYSAMNRPDDAIGTYRKAIDAQPDRYLPYLDMGAFYFAQGRYADAEGYFRRGTVLAPGQVVAHSNLGGVLINLGRYPEAEQELLQALKLRQTQGLLINLGALYNLQQRVTEALPLLEKALTLGPANVTLWSNLGYTYRRLGRAKQARDAYSRGKSLAEQDLVNNPRKPSPRASLALFSAYLGDRLRAESEIGQALRMAHDDAKLMRSAVFTYEVLGKREEALDVLRNAPPTLLQELNREPDLQGLRSDKRFAALLESRRMQ